MMMIMALRFLDVAGLGGRHRRLRPHRRCRAKSWFGGVSEMALLVVLLLALLSRILASVTTAASTTAPTQATAVVADQSNPAWEKAEADILRFLGKQHGGSGGGGDDGGGGCDETPNHPPPPPAFHIHGWRWHTLALAREASMLHRWSEGKLLGQTSSSTANGSRIDKAGNEPSNANENNECDINANDADGGTVPIDAAGLKQAANYLVEFNMKGLHAVETDLFIPWARSKADANLPSHVAAALGIVLDRLDHERRHIQTLGRDLLERASGGSEARASSSSDSDASSSVSRHALAGISEYAAAIAHKARALLELEDRLLVPTVARAVSESEQKAFNDKVIRKLGLWDSRLHLVGMHEAVSELGNDSDKRLFDTVIPGIPRRMIPRWRRLLYQPRVGVLFAAGDGKKTV